MGIAEVLADHLVDGLAVGTVVDVDTCLAHVLEAGPRLFKELARVLHGLFRLGGGIFGAEPLAVHLGAVEFAAGLAAQVNLVTGVDDHAGIAVDAGLTEPIPGVQEPEFLMSAFARNYRFQVDLHLHLGHGQRLDDKSGGHRRVAAERLTDHVVDLRTIGGVGEIGGHLADVIEA